jgi:hypothetical protein
MREDCSLNQHECIKFLYFRVFLGEKPTDKLDIVHSFGFSETWYQWESITT